MTRRKSDKDDSISLIVEKAALEEYYGSLDTNAGSAMIETVVPHQTSNWSDKALKKVGIPNIMYQEVPNNPPDLYTCQFRLSKLQRFIGSDNPDTFFKNTQRHQILYEILARTPYGALKRGEVGIDRLVNENVFKAAYPLHDGPFNVPPGNQDPKSLNLRQILYLYWGQWKCWYKYQPLDHIRQYFGEKIALYYAWLGFYTGWLLPAAVIGTLIFIFGIFLMLIDEPAKEICESGDQYVMCPLCNICGFWNLSSICSTFKAGLLFDYGGTVFFSIFMALWAVTFLEYWKRTNAILAHRWDCSEFEEIECGAGGCLIELAQELLVIMVGKQVINNVQEFILPICGSNVLLLVKDLLRFPPPVLQFGFITIFVAACPLAPLFALLNNWVEIRLDAQKFVCEYRRPVVERAQGIGIWFQIMEVITHLAVISNAFLLAFTSDFLPRLYYRYKNHGSLVGYVNFTLAYAPEDFSNHTQCRYREYREVNGDYSPTYFNLLAIRLGFVIIFEHIVFFIGRIIDLIVPDIPEEVEIKVKREHYMAKEALAENQCPRCVCTLGACVLQYTAELYAALGAPGQAALAVAPAQPITPAPDVTEPDFSFAEEDHDVIMSQPHGKVAPSFKSSPYLP
ncbi:UNVERIFIED_CONTAM: hypothetical protein FKN15_063990 [Acipenser sinensis]